MASQPPSELAFRPAPGLPGEAAIGASLPLAGGSWRVGARRLAANRTALAALAVLSAVIACTLAAPLYADEVAHTGPRTNHLTDTFTREGKRLYVVTPAPNSRPVGPGLSGRYLLGADRNGRDVMVRLLYGGRSSLFVGFVAALITVVLAVGLGLVAGYFRGPADVAIRSLFDVLWSFPALLLAIALGTALAIGGLHVGPLELSSGSLWIPAVVIGIVYVPYLGRPIRGQVLALREREFVEAAVAQGAGPVRIMVSEILPNLVSTIVVLGTLIVANDILTEAALSFLGAGVQLPEPSWGNMIKDGIGVLSTAPHLTIVPGLAIALTVLSLNLLGDGLRDALDPRSDTHPTRR